MRGLSKKIIFVECSLLILSLVIGGIWLSQGPDIMDEAPSEYWLATETVEENLEAKADLLISSEEEWLLFAENVNRGTDYADQSVCLIADLDFSDYRSIEPVGTYQSPFRGCLYGNSHTLANINMESNERYVGVIGYAEYAILDGIKVDNCYVYSADAMETGGIVAHAESSSISNCYVEGELFAEDGSAGGIVGTNFYSDIRRCDFVGSIIGSVSSSCYRDTSSGTGGIVGTNRGDVSLCNNYASVSDNSETYDSSTSRSGGIAGYNYSIIEACINYGTVTGGGIVNSNSEYSGIYYCMNIGNVYSGIALEGYQNSAIDYCVNLGKTTGRYSGDIVSWWGQDSKENMYGSISNCLYINSSKSGAVRKNYFSNSSLHNNNQISEVNTESIERTKRFLREENIHQAYNELVKKEKMKRRLQVGVLFLIILASMILIDITLIYRKVGQVAKNYKLAKKKIDESQYWLAYEILEEIGDYKNTSALLLKCVEDMFCSSEETGILKMGSFNDGITINWIKISEEGNTKIYLAESALAIDQIHSDLECDDWSDSQLAKKLNTDYKNKWFGELCEKHISVDITLPDQKIIEQKLGESSNRKCDNQYNIPGMILRSGYVYWWLKSEIKGAKMPFVSSDGLISDKGRLITSKMAIRPMIKVKFLYEENN